MKPQIYTDGHRFLRDRKDKSKVIDWFYPAFIRVHLCKSVVKISSLFRVISCLFVAKIK